MNDFNVAESLQNFGNQIGFFREDMNDVKAKLDAISGLIMDMQMKITKVEQQGIYTSNALVSNNASISELYNRVTELDKQVSAINTKLNSIPDDEKRSVFEWIKWGLPLVVKACLSLGAIAAGIGYLIDRLSR